MTFRGFFLARFGRGGRCDDLLRLVHDFHEDLYDQYLQLTGRQPATDQTAGRAGGELAGPPELTALDAARAELADGMAARWAAARPDGGRAGAADRPAGRGRRASSRRCRPVHRRRATSCSSPTGPADRSWCSTSPSAGCRFPFTRFTHCFDGDASTDRLLRADAARAAARRARSSPR